ncbi:ATP-binding cassette subfamily F protein uup [Trichococcus patagoniensis]|uniref:ATP-binding cassette subfamily F protein uup n=1 Tax=Trichococcus patagoniensis TaxID=382641 RepID=A0A2T5IKT8_9LACT|nr:ABC-F family ATP-binding cassette domain-containing protein [Trichococcus patagoniensis]PTQ84437.1 ATP-binding cassette subfamily F protein uup [Trichococcus patagoniensis]
MKDFNAIELEKSYGMKTLFNKISFTIREGEHIGLIGQNGTGKSSLLEIIAGIETPDAGNLDVPSDYRVGYLAQEPQLNKESTVFEAVYEGEAPIIKTVRAYEEALELLVNDSLNPDYQNRYSKAEADMNAQNAWQTEVQIKSILNRLGLDDITKKVGELSGGQRKRVGLAQVLIQAPDLLLLDEPTNHLDMDSITWLENYLAQYKGSVLLVTHDRYFLENAVTKIIELKNGGLEVYTGNYEDYLFQKSERDAIQQKMDEKQLKLYKSELQWMRKGAKARTTKQQARIHRFEDLEKVTQQSTTDVKLEIQLDGSRLGKRVFNLEHISLFAGDKQVLNDFSYIFQSNDRIGIVGKNGAGKTTLLNMLAGEIEIAGGNLIIGETVKIAYYKQLSEVLPDDKRVINYLQEIAEEVKLSDGIVVSVKEMLETFLFPRETHGSLISSLSGGEKRRLYLLKLLMTKPNVLLMDEPTNDLDIDTLTVLEDYLNSFGGAVITVSHDRYFLDKVADKLLILNDEGKPGVFFGDMSEYLLVSSQKDSETAKQQNKKAAATVASQDAVTEKTKWTYLEQKEWETIEDDIAALEETGQTLQSAMAENASNFENLTQLQQELDNAEAALAEKWERWEYLSQFAKD